MVEQAGSRWSELGGARVHWVDHGGPQQPASLVVCVHGLGGAAVNWAGLAPLLTDRHRVVALDLPGFGLTDPRGRGADLVSTTELLGLFVRALAEQRPGLPVVLVGNSMGGLLCALLVAAGEVDVAALVLVNAAYPSPGAVPGPLLLAGVLGYGLPPVGRAVAWGRRRLRTPRQLVGDTLRLCCVEPSAVAPDLLEAHVELARLRVARPELDRPFEQAAGSLIRHLLARRHTSAVYADLPRGLPVLVVHGTDDRLVPYAAALAAARSRPDWTLLTGRGLGHVPQLEAPQWLAERMGRWLAKVL